MGTCCSKGCQPPLLVTCATLILLASCSRPNADPTNLKQVAQGRSLYEVHCAACHGVNLEGQPNWRERLPNGKLPAPPHDATGHTWEHSDQALFEVTKFGFASKAGAKYQTDMRAFKDELSDENIWAVIAYIKSRWPQRLQEKRSQIK